jgi:hypothetical protein
VAKRRKRIADSNGIQVIVKTPVALPPASRGFYQTEEDVLYVTIYPSGAFYSYLDSSHVLLDVDRTGRLVFIQVLVPRRGWRIWPNLRTPAEPIGADIRFRGFRESLPKAVILTNTDHSVVHIRFASVRNPVRYRIADQIIFDLTSRNTLAGIWITAIEDDRAARSMAFWRKNIKQQFDKERFNSKLSRYEITP